VIDDLWDDTPEGEGLRPRQPKRRRLIDGPLRGAFLPLRDHFRDQQRAVNAPCHCCTLGDSTINYGLEYPDNGSWVLDHFPVSIERARELGREAEYSLSVANFRSAHLICNRRRGWGGSDPESDDGWIAAPSEAW
jgi:hypothetical protein